MYKNNSNNLFGGNWFSKSLFVLSLIFLCLTIITLITKIQTYDSISKEIETSRSETEHPDEYLKEQHESFIKFIKDNKEYIKTIMAEIQESNKLEISNETWLEMEQAMLASTIKIDYGKHGVNPDDFIEWMAQNWDICVKLTNEKNDGKSNKKKNPEVTSLPEADSIYFDIALNLYRTEIKQFIQQVVEKGHVDMKDQYDNYKNVIEGWIKDKYSKELNHKNKDINYKTFIDWIKSHQRDLSEYYKD